MKFRHALLALPAVAALPFAAGPAAAHGGVVHAGQDGTYQIELDALNDSGASGTAVVTVNGNSLTVKIDAEGLVPKAPHAQHIHGMPDGSKDFMCPTEDADKNGDGVVNVAEGVPSYGAITVSLTTEGDTSPKSGLAVDRMPVADEEGNLEYERTIKVPDKIADNIKNLHIVQHGIDTNDNDKYDFEGTQGKSELDPKVPAEATHPATCGMVEGSSVAEVPEGGVETGTGSTDGVESSGVLAPGGAALLTAAGLTVVAARRRTDS